MNKIPALALATLSASIAMPAMAVNESHFAFGFVTQSLEYTEDDADSESSLQGLEIRFFDRRGHWHGAFDLRFLTGTGDFEGLNRDGVFVSDDTSEVLWETEYRVGHHATPWAAPFFGIGFRRWDHDIDGPDGYKRKVEYIYSPVGVQFNGRMGRDLDWGIYAAYNFVWDGKVRSNLTRIGLPDDASNSINSGYGLDLSAEVSYELQTGAVVGIRPYYRFWEIDNTSTDSGSGTAEPDNESEALGVNVFLRF